MNFSYPSFLFALSAIAIPIIIHLFNFRKFKTVYFSNVRFLKDVKQETQSKSRLKHLLVLAARILAITCLVFAFAQPFIPVDSRKVISGEKVVSIYIDNSFSMDAVNKNGTLLDEAKKRALEIISAFKPSDRFQLLTNDFEGKHQRLVNKEEFIQLLDEVKLTPAVRSTSEVVARQSDILQQSEAKAKVSFLISDFQKTITNTDKLKNDTSIMFNMVPLLAAEKNNIYIDTCWFETPVRQVNQVENLHVRIKNSSENSIENNAIKLFVNEQQKTPASFSIEKDSETELVLSFVSRETGTQHCRIELNDYPVTFDDKFYFSFEVAKNINVLSINSSANTNATKTNYINKLFGTDSLFVLTSVLENSIDYSALANYNFVILNELKSVSSGLAQELKRFVNNGGSLLVLPNSEIDVVTYKDFLTNLNVDYYLDKDTANTKVDKINVEHELYKDVFDKKTFSATNLNLPLVNEHYTISKSSQSVQENLLRLQNGNSFFNQYSIGKGKVYLSAVSLHPDFSNFAKHAVFVPTLYKAAIYSQVYKPLFYTIGSSESIETLTNLSGENTYHIKSINNDFDIIPEHKILDSKTEILVRNQIQRSGNFNLFAGTDLLNGLAFNFNRKESDLHCYKANELMLKLEEQGLDNYTVLEVGAQSMQQSLMDIQQGKKLWKLFVVLTLLFLAIEIALLRFMK
ncbi:MAG: BatA domain-containing protein [Bacteroidia bacterium]